MGPCPFVRIVVGNLGLKFMDSSVLQSCYSKSTLRGFNNQYSNVPLLVQERDAIESRNHACFNLSKTLLEKLVEQSSSNGEFPHLKIEIYEGNRVKNCGFWKNGKLLVCIVFPLDLKRVLESANGGFLIHNGWIFISDSKAKVHLNVRAEPDPRFVFQFDGEPECSPQVFQVNGDVKQPVFTCFRNSGERNLRSRKGLMDPCPFIRIVVGNLGLVFMDSSVFRSCYSKSKLRGFNNQYSNVPVLVQERYAIESRNHACFNLSKTLLEKLVEQSSSNGIFPHLKIKIYEGNRVKNCGFWKNGKLLVCIVFPLDLKRVLESANGGFLIHNGWIFISDSKAKVHLNVRAEPDPRFVFQFDGEPECSPEVFQVNGNVSSLFSLANPVSEILERGT